MESARITEHHIIRLPKKVNSKKNGKFIFSNFHIFFEFTYIVCLLSANTLKFQITDI